MFHAQNIQRPQLRFEDKVDNSNTTPSIRKIKVKYHAKKPLDDGMPSSGQLTPEMAMHIKSLGITDVHSSQFRCVIRICTWLTCLSPNLSFSLPHPYQYEIDTLEYPEHELQIRPEVLYSTMEETPYKWVDNPDALNELIAILESQQEIAVDLEVCFGLKL
jgi:exosome complex exonuclease RRP6